MKVVFCFTPFLFGAWQWIVTKWFPCKE